MTRDATSIRLNQVETATSWSQREFKPTKLRLEMAGSYNEYLAIQILSEDRIVSYRTLSRALKVHVNQSKQMLYDFHRSQRAKKPGSIHATYLISGIHRPEAVDAVSSPNRNDSEDGVMQSSPFPSSMAEPDPEETPAENIMVTGYTLAREEDLEEAKSRFSEVTSIHIFSLQPNPLKDLQVLTTCSQEILSKYANEDPIEAPSQYGTIQNLDVRRRNCRGLPSLVPKSSVTNTSVKPVGETMPNSTGSAEASVLRISELKKPISHSSTPHGDPSTQPPKKSDAKPPSLKQTNSDIFKSFAKARAKPKNGDTASPVEATRAPNTECSTAEDEPMKDSSDGEQEEFVFSWAKGENMARETKADREDRLRRMMEEDIPMKDAPILEEEEKDVPIDKQLVSQTNQKEETAITVSGGRRRGRRRVMKKRTMKDEEGYLVTKEEPIWESFSEDEPQPKKARMPITTGIKGKKTTGKQTQGSIRSFFSKK